MRALPKQVIVVMLVLCAGAASLGLWLGSRPALDEGTVILRYAERYASQTGQSTGDCHGVPGRRADIWLVVLCDGAAGRFAYPVGPDGRLVEIVEDEA
ncbi:hypothetical protein ACS3SW_00970 [Roseobacteraceae bacterium S113]